MPRERVSRIARYSTSSLLLRAAAFPCVLPFSPHTLQFDRKVSDEPVRPKDRARRKRLPNEVGAATEARRSADILRKVLGGSGEGERAAPGGVGGGAGGGGAQMTGGKRKRPGK